MTSPRDPRVRPPQPERPIPPGRVSRVRGRYQIPILRGLTLALLVTSLAAVLAPAPVDGAIASATVGAVIATPLARVLWLCVRFASEGDRRFVAVTAALLLVAGAGAAAVGAGIGR